MTDDTRLQELLDELLDSHHTPEEVCGSCPELLPEVRARLQQMNRVQAELDALFPPPCEPGSPPPAPPLEDTALPRIPGYEVESVLGRGGMGVVYKARQVKLNRVVALKMILAAGHAGQAELARFRTEAEAVARLQHPNIVQVFEVGEHDGQSFLSLEFCPGGSLARKLNGTPLPPHESAQLVEVLARAMQAAHDARVIHRDLKPGNVLLGGDGTPKVSDFGLAKKLDEAGQTISGAVMGTPSYMAPEQARGKKDVGPAADVYALGAILYQCLTGRPPFKGPNAAETLVQVISEEPRPPRQVNNRIARDLETICLNCLHKEPRLRYASAAALAEDLQHFLRGEAITARAQGWLGRLARAIRRRPTLTVGLVGVLLLATALLGGGLRVRAVRADAERAQEQLDRLDRARRDQELVARLDDIHLNRVALASERSDWRSIRAQAEREYEEAFRAAGFGAVHDDPELVAAQLRASAIREALVAALDDWTVCAADPRRRNWLLAVARKADPDPTGWRDRARDPTVWEEPAALATLARAAPVQEQTVRLVAAMAERLQETGADAIPLLEKVQQKRPGDFWANLALSNALRLKNRHGERIRYYQAALALRPGSAVVYNNLGHALVFSGRMDEAIVRFRQAIQLDPGFARAHSNLGSALKFKRQYAEAIDHYRQALVIEPKNAGIHSNLGVVLAEMGRLDEAIDWYRHALRLDPRCASAHSNLGAVLGMQGKLDEAIDHLRQAIRFDPARAGPHHNLGCALLSRGQTAEAMVHFQQAVQLQPDYAPAHLRLGDCLKEVGRLDEAVRHFEQALALDVGDPKARKALRSALLQQGKWEEVCVAWRKELEANPPAHDAWYGYAELCLFLGWDNEYRRARKALLGRFGATTDGFIAERTGRASLLFPASDDELRRVAALVHRAVADRSKPAWTYPYFQFVEGLVEYRQGHFDRAISTMRGEASGVLGPAPRLVLAMALHQNGQPAAARKTLALAVLAHDWRPNQVRDQDGCIYHVLRREAERMILPSLPAFLEGKYQPQDNDERMALLGVCQFTNRCAALARLYGEAFAADPLLAEDVRSGHRFNAARAAALAGWGRGEDAASLSDEERTGWRMRARQWLRADLAAWNKALNGNTAETRELVRRTLASWRSDPDLAGLRELAELKRLSVKERKDSLALWEEVSVVLARIAK